MVFEEIESGAVALVMRFWYAVFQSVVDAVSGIVYPAVSEKTPVPLVYVSPVAVEERRPRAVVEKSEIVDASTMYLNRKIRVHSSCRR